jgi:hypothetical protein
MQFIPGFDCDRWEMGWHETLGSTQEASGTPDPKIIKLFMSVIHELLI